MPSSSENLRQVFLVDDDDGILRCESLIKLCLPESYINNFIIFIDTKHKEKPTQGTALNLWNVAWDCIDYLVNEWDYGLDFIETKIEVQNEQEKH